MEKAKSASSIDKFVGLLLAVSVDFECPLTGNSIFCYDSGSFVVSQFSRLGQRELYQINQTS